MMPRTLESFVVLLLSILFLSLRVNGFFVSKQFQCSRGGYSYKSQSSPSRLNAHASLPMPTEITSHVDWMELLHGHDDDRLTLVLFKASFCKSCHRLELDWRHKIVPQQQQQQPPGTANNNHPNLELATVEFTKNRDLFKKLGVQGLPAVHFYHRGRLLTGYPCPPKEFPRIMESLCYYLNASPSELEFEADMEPKRLTFEQEVPSSPRRRRSHQQVAAYR
jgi:thioredoxin-related protein